MQTMSDGVFRSVCSLDCPDQCGLLVHRVDGRIVKVEGDPDHPVTKGHICHKVRRMTDRIYDEKRLTHPLRRTGPKGTGQFEQITWEEAVDTITSRWKILIDSEGPESILPYSFYGNMGRLAAEGMDRRFFHRLGASRLDRTICSTAGAAGYSYTMGAPMGSDPEDTIDSKLFIFWGINAASTNMHQIALALKARKQNGAKLIVIDVHKNQTGRLADWFIPILPGTDTALALGMMHILFEEDLVDTSFLEKHTIGHRELRDHVRLYDPQTVSGITGVPAGDIRKLGRMYGNTSPAFIRIGNGIQHHDNGGMCIRTIACLPALTGQWLVKGGGAIKGNSGYTALNTNKLQRPDLLKNPHTRILNMNLLGDILLSENPLVKSLYIYGTNPAVVAPEANKVREGLSKDDLFTVVHDLFLTETAKYADIILPAASSFESTDFYTSSWHRYIQIQQPVIGAYGESKSNVEVFRLLAKGMGFSEEAFAETEAEMIDQALDNPRNPCLEGINFAKLSEEQFVKISVQPMFPGKLPSRSGKIELFSQKMEEEGFPPLPTHVPLPEDSGLPYAFVPGPNHHFLNTTFSNNDKHMELEKEPRLYMNRKDALASGIEDGDFVRVWNHRGECVLKLSVGDLVLPGVVATQGLWSDSVEGNGNGDGDGGSKLLVNSLTPARIADMGGGATFFSGRVGVEKTV